MKLFQNSSSAVKAICVFLAIFVLGLALARCHAAEAVDAPYVQFSGGATVVRGSTQVIDITFTEPAIQLQHAFWQESLMVIGASTFQGQYVPNSFVVRGGFCPGFGRFDICLGVGWIQNYLPYNGEHFNANLQLDYRFERLPVTVTYTHLSDAGSTPNNLGRDILLVGWRFH